MSIKILLIAEQKEGQLSPVSYELITAAKKAGGEIMTACLAENTEEMASKLAARGGGTVLAVANPALKYFADDVYARVINAMIAKHKPHLVLGPATFYGKALVSRLAALNEGAMASDIVGLKAEDSKVTVTRPVYGGNIIAEVSGQAGERPFFATLRPKVFDESKEGDGNVTAEEIDAALFESRTAIREMVGSSGETVTLNEADIIVSAGRGVRGPENVGMVRELADSLKAALGASRAIVDAGWIEYSHQVGQTGKTVNPKLYFAVGISGAIQHLVGMQTSKTIVAINRDKDAPIFNIASYGIVGDLFEIVPALTKRFSQGS